MGVTLDSLRDDPKYSNDLIDGLKSGDLSVLGALGEKINSLDFMQSLIYAYKNDNDNYDLFLQAGPAVQRAMAVEIFSDNPELILETDLADDKEFIKANLHLCPKIVQYIPEDIRTSPQVVEIIKDIQSTSLETPSMADVEKTTFYMERIESQPDLRGDAEFMTEAIQNDPSILELAAKELKENFDFMREQSRGNEAVIDVVVSKTDEFNFDAIQAVRESSRELTVNDCMDLIDQYIEKNKDPRYQKVKDKIIERGIEDPHTMKWVTAMVAQMDDVSPELMKKILDYSILTMEKTKKDIGNDGEMHVDIGASTALIKPEILEKILEKVKAAGYEVDPTLEERLGSYKEFNEGFQKKLTVYKQENRERLLAEAMEGKMKKEVEVDKIGEFDTEEEPTEPEEDKKVSLDAIIAAVEPVGMETIEAVMAAVKQDRILPSPEVADPKRESRSER